MEIFIFIILGLTLWHFVYDGIILPSFRLHARNKLFILRDQLRNLAMDPEEKYSREVFDIMEKSFTVNINHLHHLTISVMVDFYERYDNDELFKKHIDRRVELISNCKNEKIISIKEKLNAELEKVLIVNIGSWFIYMVPIVIAIMSIKKVATFAKDMIVITDQDASILMPKNLIAQ